MLAEYHMDGAWRRPFIQQIEGDDRSWVIPFEVLVQACSASSSASRGRES